MDGSRYRSVCRSRRGSAAARRMRRRLCGCWRGRTTLRRTIPASCRRRARPALTCRYVLIRARALMRGIGELLSDPLDLPRLFAVLLNPGVAVADEGRVRSIGRPSGGGKPRRQPFVRARRRCLPRLPAAATTSRARRSSSSPRSPMLWPCFATCRGAGLPACRVRGRRVSVCSTRWTRREEPPGGCGSAIPPGGCARRRSRVEGRCRRREINCPARERPNASSQFGLRANSTGRCRTRLSLRALLSSPRRGTKRAHPWRSRRSGVRA